MIWDIKIILRSGHPRGDFPGGPTVKTPHFHCRGHRFNPWPGNSKASACNVGDMGSIPGSGRCPAEGNGYPFQYSCLENSVDRGAWQAIVLGVTKESGTT